jgi:hypothetical protein
MLVGLLLIVCNLLEYCTLEFHVSNAKVGFNHGKVGANVKY